MEVLFGLLKATMCIAGILFFLLLIFSIVNTTIKNIKLNKMRKEFNEKLDNIIDVELEKLYVELSKKEPAKKRDRPKKKDIQK
jgi:hypothetical protein